MTSTLKSNIKLAELTVCKMTGISQADLYRASREKELAEARFMVWRLAREELKVSLSEIGRIYDKDHTTIINGVKRARQQPLVVNYQRFITKYQIVSSPPAIDVKSLYL